MNKVFNKQEAMSMLDKSVDSQSLNIDFTTTNDSMYDGINMTSWDYWNNYYHPYAYPSYPVYIQERAKDSSRQAFEIVKMLNDKKKLNIKTVKDFIDVMDTLIKIL